MERTLVQDRENLVFELSSWNKQEAQFKALFSEQALKDRSFMRMKLAEYNRLWYKYGGKASTTDERAMLLMLRFQRRKMEKTLYPGLLRRLLYRAATSVRATIRQRREANRKKDDHTQYVVSSIPVNDQQVRQGNDTTQDQTASQYQRKHQGWNLGRRQQQSENKGQGLKP